METKEKLRSSIVNRVKKLSDDKLPNLDSFLSDLESGHSTDKSSLSFSGIFKELELSELTSELHKNRESTNERIPLF